MLAADKVLPEVLIKASIIPAAVAGILLINRGASKRLGEGVLNILAEKDNQYEPCHTLYH